jgi:hypothetical protein
MADAGRWAAGMRVPAYATDHQTAIKVTDGTVEVVSEGHWKLLPQARKQANRAHEARAARLGQCSGMFLEPLLAVGSCKEDTSYGIGGRAR